MSGFWYLGSPYSKFPYGISSAHLHVCRAAALLIKAGVPIFSPIAHTHPIAMVGDLDPLDHAIWLPADEPIMKQADGMIVLKIDGWAGSYGLAQEVEWFAGQGKPIVYMEPGVVPEGLLP